MKKSRHDRRARHIEHERILTKHWNQSSTLLFFSFSRRDTTRHEKEIKSFMCEKSWPEEKQKGKKNPTTTTTGPKRRRSTWEETSTDSRFFSTLVFSYTQASECARALSTETPSEYGSADEIESRPLWCAFGSWCCAGIFIVFVVGWNWQSFNLLISINMFTGDLSEPLRQERSWFWNFNRHWTHSYVLFFLLYVVFTTRMKFNFTAHENHQKKPARESSWSSERARILCWVLWCDCVHI